jgi:hypothetical protein
MTLVEGNISKEELLKMAENQLSDFVKAVVDIEKEIMVIDAELHSDEEMFLLDNGSNQKDLWGINIFPGKSHNEWVEFDSMINLRPRNNNRSRGVEDPEIRKKIVQIVNNLVQ